MWNKLAGKAIFPVALAVTGFVIVCCLLFYSFIQNDLTNDTVRHETNLSDTIIKSTRYAMLKDDREMLGQMIDNIGEQEGVEHVRIFNKRGLIMFSADPSEVHRMVDKDAAGCIECHSGARPDTHLGTMERARRFTNPKGKEVLAITAPIYNESGCSASSCHVHSPEVKVLGTLDIGLSQEPLRQSLANLRNRMIMFCLMILVLTVGGISALLRRNVLLPIRQLVLYAEALKRGDRGVEPPRGATEIESLARSLEYFSQSAPEKKEPSSRGTS